MTDVTPILNIELVSAVRLAQRRSTQRLLCRLQPSSRRCRTAGRKPSDAEAWIKAQCSAVLVRVRGRRNAHTSVPLWAASTSVHP